MTGTYFLRISSCISVGEGPAGFAPEEQKSKYQHYFTVTKNTKIECCLSCSQ